MPMKSARMLTLLLSPQLTDKAVVAGVPVPQAAKPPAATPHLAPPIGGPQAFVVGQARQVLILHTICRHELKAHGVSLSTM